MDTQLEDAATFTSRDFEIARTFVDTPHGRIAYVERGRGPVALLIHGALLSGYQWRHQLSGLSDIRRVIALDTLGMGHTQVRPGQSLALPDQAAMFRAFLDALDIADVDLVGNDSGGGAAQIFAARNPGRIRTMTLTNCEVDDHDDRNPAFTKFRDSVASGSLVKALQAAAGRPDIGRKAFAAAYQHPEDLSDDTIRTYTTPLVASPERVELLTRYVASIAKRDLIEIRAELAALPAPTLVLWGNADGFFPMAMAHWLRDHLARVTEVVELDGARVFWPEERPALLNARLRAHWLAAG
ncbi:MAG TPA: alpha/beta fold hydrolase [Kofleriaceae bacterium]|jgi:pimeloyl-ACP methyl ester carboxylesterase|nr:alpha/beta fold hydrolase [Kofleriaceae bacterium]